MMRRMMRLSRLQSCSALLGWHFSRSILYVLLCSMLAIVALGRAVSVTQAAFSAAEDTPLVLVLTMDGALSPAMKEYLDRAIQYAENQQTSARPVESLVLQLDTPGGSIDLMTDMVESMRSSTVPIIVYVSPRGAMAGSAGTVITLAGHLAAMAPETAIGAASPVGSSGEELGETIQAKTKNILKATVRSLAEQRGPQAVKLAEDTIENASAVSAQEALEIGLIDFIAVDIPDLLRQADGYTVSTAAGEVTLELAGATTQPFNYTLIEQLLAVLTNPSIVFLLLFIGVQAILIEMSSPGGWVAGFIGVVCLALAGYGMGVLSVNWFGLIFLVIAVVLFILDLNAATHGALTAAGVASLIVAGMVLFNSPGVPSFQRVPISLIVGASVSIGIIFFAFMALALRSLHAIRLHPARVGAESLAGRSGTARSELNPSGLVHLNGEHWSAELAPGEPVLHVGERVVVVAVHGLKLIVRSEHSAQREHEEKALH